MYWFIYLCCIICSFHMIGGYYDSLSDKDISHPDDYLDIAALNTFRKVQKKSFRYFKRQMCRRWNSHCVPWSNLPAYTCCSGLSCKCNIWMQNCRCLSRLWGK